jgi:cytochrome c-type protein NapC
MKPSALVRVLVVALAVVLVPAGVVAAWMITEVAIEATSGPDFCTTCHTMAPFARTFRADVHGGSNPNGTAALCTDCHLRHDNVAAYLWTKARFGLHDVWAQLTYDLDAIDWRAGLAERAEYTFDSGCLKCHRALADARGNQPAFVAHRPYFLGEIERKCVACHPHVGHRELAAALPPATLPPGTEKGADP